MSKNNKYFKLIYFTCFICFFKSIYGICFNKTDDLSHVLNFDEKFNTSIQESNLIFETKFNDLTSWREISIDRSEMKTDWRINETIINEIEASTIIPLNSNKPSVAIDLIQSNKNYISSQEIPQSFLIQQKFMLPSGFIATYIKFLNSQGSAGVVFKFQNYTEYGFLLLRKNASMSPDIFTIYSGHVNNNVLISFPTVTVYANTTGFNLLGVQYSLSALNIYLNGLQVINYHFKDTWEGVGSFGLTCLESSVSFRNLIGGYMQSPLYPTSMKAFENASDTIAKNISQESESKTMKTSKVSKNQIAKQLETAQKIKNDSCSNYAKTTPDLGDWLNARSWVILRDKYEKTLRIAPTQRQTSETIYPLVLKGFNCSKAALSVQLIFAVDSEGGFVVFYKNPEEFYSVTIDTARKAARIRQHIKGFGKLLALINLPNAWENEKHLLEATYDNKSYLLTVSFNKQKVLEYNYGKFIKHLNYNVGLWSSIGSVQFANLTVSSITH